MAFIGALALPTSAGAFVYWGVPYATNKTLPEGVILPTSAIGRANLDGSAVNKRFVTGDLHGACEVAVDGAHIYWAGGYWKGRAGRSGYSIGRANLDGSAVNKRFIALEGPTCGVAVDGAHIYWANESYNQFEPTTIGRAKLDGSAVNRNFIPLGQGSFPPRLVR